MSIIKIKSPPSLCDLEQHVAIYLKDADISIMCYTVCTFLSHMKGPVSCIEYILILSELKNRTSEFIEYFIAINHG